MADFGTRTPRAILTPHGSSAVREEVSAVNEDETKALQERIEDKVGDYLLDCRLNYWEPAADRIAEIVMEVLRDA